MLILQSGLALKPPSTYQIFMEKIILYLFPESVREPQNIVYSAQLHMSYKIQEQIYCF